MAATLGLHFFKLRPFPSGGYGALTLPAPSSPSVPSWLSSDAQVSSHASLKKEEKFFWFRFPSTFPFRLVFFFQWRWLAASASSDCDTFAWLRITLLLLLQLALCIARQEAQHSFELQRTKTPWWRRIGGGDRVGQSQPRGVCRCHPHPPWFG